MRLWIRDFNDDKTLNCISLFFLSVSQNDLEQLDGKTSVRIRGELYQNRLCKSWKGGLEIS